MEIKTKKELEEKLYDIWNLEATTVAQLAIENHQCQFCDGVVQLDLENGELFGAPFTQGTIENPANPFIEIYRIKQTEDLSDICQFCSGYDECYKNDELIDKESFHDCVEDTVIEAFREEFDKKMINLCIENAEEYLEGEE